MILTVASVKVDQGGRQGTMSERTEEILEAACRVITRGGVDRLRMSDVAAEAGVSSALVHYYFATRSALVASAFERSDIRADERATRELVGAGQAAASKLERLLRVYVGDDAVIRENWLLWREMWSHALFEPELRPALRASYEGWVEQVAELVREGVLDGSAGAGVDADGAARRLTAIVDGLGPQVLLGMLDPDRAGELIREAVTLELQVEARVAG